MCGNVWHSFTFIHLPIHFITARDWRIKCIHKRHSFIHMKDSFSQWRQTKWHYFNSQKQTRDGMHIHTLKCEMSVCINNKSRHCLVCLLLSSSYLLNSDGLPRHVTHSHQSINKICSFLLTNNHGLHNFLSVSCCRLHLIIAVSPSIRLTFNSLTAIAVWQLVGYSRHIECIYQQALIFSLHSSNKSLIIIEAAGLKLSSEKYQQHVPLSTYLVVIAHWRPNSHSKSKIEALPWISEWQSRLSLTIVLKSSVV